MRARTRKQSNPNEQRLRVAFALLLRFRQPRIYPEFAFKTRSKQEMDITDWAIRVDTVVQSRNEEETKTTHLQHSRRSNHLHRFIVDV